MTPAARYVARLAVKSEFAQKIRLDNRPIRRNHQ
jgi:hypothetical protein